MSDYFEYDFYVQGMRPGIPVAPRALRFDLKDGHDEKHKTALLRWLNFNIYSKNKKSSQIVSFFVKFSENLLDGFYIKITYDNL